MKDQSCIRSQYECVASAGTGKGCISSLAVKGSLLFATSHSASIFIFEKVADVFSRVAEIECGAPVKAVVSVDSTGTRLFTGHHDGKIRVWTHPCDGRRLKLATTLPTLKDCIRNLMKPGSFVQIRRHRKRLWMTHADAVSCLAFSCSEDAELLYSGSWDKTVKVWRLSDFRCIESIPAHHDAVNAVACARINGGLLFTGSADGTVRMWIRRTTGRNTKHDHVATLVKSGSGAVNCLGMSGDESILYCGTSDGRIYYWNIDYNPVEIMRSEGVLVSAQKSSVFCLATLKQFVCSGGADGTIRVWRREGGDVDLQHRCMAVIEGHRSPVKCITAASPASSAPSITSLHYSNHHDSGLVIYSGNADGTLKIWWVNVN
ncbi:hypothetical protein KI387_023548 [Taxus chinensis]|uniref:Uncharacterized protein n=1 Tax=Taxus chinensis TaxID=29808 RepID=A0AA38G2P3_TAXCH|nr:hypothetical protein KI387_023548 [Taxus chinensis]